MEFPKIRGTMLGVPVIRIIVVLGPILGPLIYGNIHILFPDIHENQCSSS